MRQGLAWHIERGAEIQPRSWSQRPSLSPAHQPQLAGLPVSLMKACPRAARGWACGGTGRTETRQGRAEAGPGTGKRSRSHMPGDTDALSRQEVWGRAAAWFLPLLAQPCLRDAGALHLYQLFRLPSPLQTLPPTPGVVIPRLELHTHFCFASGPPQNRPLGGAGGRPWGWRRHFLLLSASLQQPLFTRQRPFLLNQFAVFPTDTASWYPLGKAWVQAAVGSYYHSEMPAPGRQHLLL